MKFVLALDQGTTSSRAILFDHRGRPRATAQQEFKQLFPKPGWVEHDPLEIWNSQFAVAKKVLKRANVKADDIVAIGITNQRETTIVWDRETGKPIYNAIVWQDRRTSPHCDRLKAAGHQKKFQQKTGLVLDPYFSGTKLQWILDHVPGARKKSKQGQLAFGTVDSWLIWNLTGGKIHATDATNASRTLLLNIHRGDWDDDLLKLLKIPKSVLPEVKDSSGVVGYTSPKLFGREIPIAGIAGDQQAALFGQLCTEPGMIKNTYGTGCFMLMQTGPKPVRSKNNLLTTIAWQIDGRRHYALEGSVFIAGAVVQWLRDGLKIISSSREIEKLSNQVSDNGGVYFVPAFAGLGAPHWDPYARGAILGLTRGTTGAHIARAALESIAYQVADVLHAMKNDSGIAPKELRVDGGASVNNWLMQFQSDLLGVPVTRPKNTETTALGAAYLAGLAVGFWKNTSELSKQWKQDKKFRSAMTRQQQKAFQKGWERALSRAKKWIER